MKRWLMRCHPSSEDLDWGRYGVLSFDDKWLRNLWKMTDEFKRVKKSVASLAELVVWDYSLNFYDKLPQLNEDYDERLDKYDYIELERREWGLVNEDDHLTRVECEELHIIDDGAYIYWSVIVKHTDVRVDTPRIFIKDFECQLHGRNPRKARTCLACISKS